MIVADEVGATLEQRHGDRRSECLAHRRKVACKELILERLGAGGDDDFAACQQCGHEVGEGLAGAGASLDDEHFLLLDGLRDCLCHLNLLAA